MSAGAGKAPQRARRSAPVSKPSAKTLSLRLSPEERARLEAEAGSQSLSAYVRGRLFAEDAAPRRKGGRTAVKNAEALCAVLSALGRSDLAAGLMLIQTRLQAGYLFLDEDSAAALAMACLDVQAMRRDLLKALGLPGDAKASDQATDNAGEGRP